MAATGKDGRRLSRVVPLLEPFAPFVLFAAVLIAWSFGAAARQSDLVLPAPWSVVTELWRMLTEDNFLLDIWISLLRQIGGFLAACIVALPLGFLMALVPAARPVIAPFVAFSRFLPAASLLPILIVWFGIGDLPKIALLFLGVVPFLISSVAEEVARVPVELHETARTLGATVRQVRWRVVVPAAAPGLVEAMRIMMGIGWTYIVVAELVGANEGIGARIIEAQRFLNTSRVMAGILTIGFLGLLQDLFFRGVSRVCFPYLYVRQRGR